MSLHPTALEILNIVREGAYVSATGLRVDVGALMASADQSTEVLTPDDLAAMLGPDAGGDESRGVSDRAAPPTRIEVIDATTQEAARDYGSAPGGVVVLNYASAKNPGGGFLGGARAQEEEVCRCSGLYPLLARQTAYYDANRAFRSGLYTDHMIYSRDVPFFRTATNAPLLDAPFLASVITAPAPNAGALMQNDPSQLPQIRGTFERRWGYVLALAEARKHRTLILGAWGCGAFRNDPEVAASTVGRWLRGSSRFAGRFDRVVFAIPGTGRSLANLHAFRRVLEPRG